MQLRTKALFFKRLKEWEKIEAVAKATRYAADTENVSVRLEALTAEQRAELRRIGEEGKTKGERGARVIVRKLRIFDRIDQDVTGARIKNLDALASAFKSYVGLTKHKWLFHDVGGRMEPYYVSNIQFIARKRRVPAHTEVTLERVRRGKLQTWVIEFFKLEQRDTARNLLASRGFYQETSELYAQYLQELERYRAYQPLTGAQFLATGVGELVDRAWWASGNISMERESAPTKVVMDDLFERDKRNEEDDEDPGADAMTTLMWFWKRSDSDLNRFEDEDDDAPEGAEEWPLPVALTLRVFDLNEHQYVDCHAAQLTPYQYDGSLIRKLVLPEHKKTLVNILIHGSTSAIGDIVAGKMKGIIVIATGEPGTGKTLTAEVFSEAIERPLYVVQCSQLGTDESTIETQLKQVMQRASRWRAILLIDEADVYIRARQNDIHQNAIVGVFLRILEYYRGVLFMTSNKAVVIDDAVMSRASAWIKYELPNKRELHEIWSILAEQFRVKLPDSSIDKLVEAFPKIPGRAVRNLLRLGALLAARNKKPVDVELIKYVAQFQDLEASREAS